MNRAKYIEETTKKFIQKKVFREVDASHSKNESVNLRKLFGPIGFNMVLQTCFGKELQSLYDDKLWKNWCAALQKSRKMSVYKGVITWTMILLLIISGHSVAWITSIYHRNVFFPQIYAMRDVITDYIQKHDGNDEHIEKYIEKYAKCNYSKEELFGDLAVMFSSSTETTANALCICLLYLAKYQDLQNELFDELVVAFGADINKIELKNDGILKIPKLRAFVHEMLRMHPLSSIVGVRQINNKNGIEIDTTDYKKDATGKIYKIPQNMNVMVNVIGIAMDSKYWKSRKSVKSQKSINVNMNDIHFEFWLDDENKFSKTTNKDSFLTFGLGKRDCIGQPLAIKQIYVIVLMMLTRYKIKFDHDIKEEDEDAAKVEIKTVFDGVNAVYVPVITHVRMEQR